MLPLRGAIEDKAWPAAPQQQLTRTPRSDNTSSSPSGYPILVKVASDQAVLASSGAFQNITALLPSALQNYVAATLGHVSDAFAGPNEYLTARGASPTVLYSTLAGAAAVALSLIMSRYGWTANREGLSPFASQANSQEMPHVTDDDFSYITSEDLEGSLQPPVPSYDPQGRRAPTAAGVEDDILLIKNKNVTYPVHFPAYSIGDGKLLVQDVRDRAGLVMDLSARRARRVKMLYKGRQLKEQDIPIRDYGVKNNSELLVVVPEGKISDDEDSSSSAEEVVVMGEGKPKKKKNSKDRKKKPNKDRGTPHDSTASLGVPGQTEGDSRRASPSPSRQPSRVPSPAVPSGPIGKLEAIRSHFDAELLPICRQFTADPPKDAKKREDEHRKLTETVMQHVLLKLDEVETGGDPDIRSRRKDLVNYVQDILKELDELMPAGTKINR
ncbi:Uu.00g050360.m01.CDS01 [Anthostomella pinea]|uniref:Uu.00g050360.m01.CDS01 n=1 Tax=Anthostomella pinea TaxID=933095 RepID=A0AAI8VTF6_9PEZI|nr:Uu.00g050360.m01.CDS01 [Anthostomella pinea]